MTESIGRRQRALRGFALALAIGAPAGWLCAWLNWPLPWMIGPLVACALASAKGLPLHGPRSARAVGQWAIGAALGLYFTPEAISRITELWLPIVAAIGWSVLIGLGCAWAMRRFAGADPATAFFAGAVGNASEMALQGERNGGRVETIAAVHSMRIMTVVITVPFAFRWLDLHGTDLFMPAASSIHWPALAGLILATVVTAFALHRLRSPSPWVMGSLLASSLLTATGQVATAMPAIIIIGGQLLIGIALGTRFAPGFMQRAPLIVLTGSLASLVSIGFSAVFGLALARLAAIAPATMVLAVAPGGIAEMSLTAQVLGLGVPIVTVFHVTRMAALLVVLGGLYRWFARRRRWPLGPI